MIATLTAACLHQCVSVGGMHRTWQNAHGSSHASCRAGSHAVPAHSGTAAGRSAMRTRFAASDMAGASRVTSLPRRCGTERCTPLPYAWGQAELGSLLASLRASTRGASVRAAMTSALSTRAPVHGAGLRISMLGLPLGQTVADWQAFQMRRRQAPAQTRGTDGILLCSVALRTTDDSAWRSRRVCSPVDGIGFRRRSRLRMLKLLPAQCLAALHLHEASPHEQHRGPSARSVVDGGVRIRAIAHAEWPRGHSWNRDLRQSMRAAASEPAVRRFNAPEPFSTFWRAPRQHLRLSLMGRAYMRGGGGRDSG